MKIDGTWYNVSAISQITFEEFRSTMPKKTNDFCKNIYQMVTGKSIEEPKPVEKKKGKKDIEVEKDIEEIKE